MRIDGELSLGTTDMAGWTGDGVGMVAQEGGVVSAYDNGASPFGATDLILMARVSTAFNGGTSVTLTLVSRDSAPDLVPGSWNRHTSMPTRLEADCTLNEWFQPIRVPANAGRYLGLVLDCFAGDTVVAGAIQAFFVRECDLPQALQLFPTP